MHTASVYDYLVYSFFTALAEANADSMDWRAMRVAVERVESGIIDSDLLSGCLKIVKTIGLLNLFFKQIKIDDRVARREVTSQLQHKANLLNICINENLTANNGAVTWIFRGKAFPIESAKDINRLLSEVCEEVYHQTPIIKNELFNRQKLSSAISLTRVTLFDAMLAHNGEKDFGIAETAFPPEKTIYYTLFHETGIHQMDDDGTYYLDEPTTDGIMPLWNECCRFLESSVDKEQKLTTLIKTLKEKPFKLKQGVIDFWLPIFLFVKQQSFALYNGNTFVLDINKEVFELLQKRPAISA